MRVRMKSDTVPATPMTDPKPPLATPQQGQQLTYERAPLPSPVEHLRFKLIGWDIAIIFALTFFGGCVVGAVGAAANSGKVPVALAISNLVLTTGGFTLSGFRAPRGKRWPHLAFVALGVWIASLLNVFVFGVPGVQWLLSGPFIAVCMGAGGGIATLFALGSR